MTLSRWQPARDFLSLREAMDRMFEDAMVRRPNGDGGTGLVPFDVIERDDEVLVRAPIPGFEPDDVDVSVQGDTLSVRGTMRQEQEREEESYHLREWRTGSFQRTVRLPSNVEADQADAEYKNGVLSVRLPKRAEETTRRIEVKSE